jgi:hypothetical protein
MVAKAGTAMSAIIAAIVAATVNNYGPKRELRSIQRSSGDRGGSEISLGGGW